MNQHPTESFPESFQSLLKANRILASTLDIEKLLKIVLELASEVVSAQAASLLLLDERTGELVFDIALGARQDQLRQIRLKMGEGIAGWVAQEKKSLIVNDPRNDSRWSNRMDEKTQFVTQSILCVPMVHQGKVWGVVQTINKKSQQGFTDFDRVMLEAFASQTVVAIQNARMVASLTAEKEKLDTVFSQMAEGAIYFNENDLVVFANPAACRLLGIHAENLLRCSARDVFADFTLNLDLDLLQNITQTIVSFQAEYNKGYDLVLSGVIKKIYSDKKDWVGTLWVFKDETQIRKDENLKRSFLALISHKLRTPLSTITGYVPLLLEDVNAQKMPARFVRAIESIGVQGQKLKELVEKLIAFSSLQANAVRMDRKTFKSRLLLDEVVLSMQTYLEKNKVDLLWQGDWKKLPQLYVDYDMFGEIIKSLIENAVKFNVKSEKKILCRGWSDDNNVYISITDDGPGIAPQEQENIFKNFYQIDQFFTGTVEGAGLGLTLVKRFVQMHGASIEVESEMGQGSTFTLAFPIKGE